MNISTISINTTSISTNRDRIAKIAMDINIIETVWVNTSRCRDKIGIVWVINSRIGIGIVVMGSSRIELIELIVEIVMVIDKVRWSCNNS